MAQCEICKNGPQDGVTVFRVNPTGVKGVWRCMTHLTLDQIAAIEDPELFRLTDAIEGKDVAP